MVVDLRKSNPVSVRLPFALKEVAEQAAKADARSLSSLLEKALREYLKANGYPVP